MSGIGDDANFIFKKLLKIADKVTNSDVTHYFYEDVKTGRVTSTTTKKDGALDGNTPEPADTKGTGKTTLNAENVFGAEQASSSAYPTNGVDSKAYAIDTVTSGDPAEYEDQGETIQLGKAPRSLFNNWTLHRYANRAGVANFQTDDTNGTHYNVPVFSKDPKNQILNPTAKNIVEYSQKNGGESFAYQYSDFIQMEHYGQISNDYLITLRRFAYPVGDDLLTPKTKGTTEMIDSSTPDLARAVTWLSPKLGNSLEEILKFKVGYKWKDAESQIQDAASNTSDGGVVGNAIGGSAMGSAIESGLNGYTATQAATKRKQGNVDYAKETYPNKVFGPLNIIDKVLAREKGLEFSQEFKLSFHYDLKSYAGTSPKVAFMDTMANVLALTYSNAPFWGGATRFSGSGKTGKPFGDTSLLAKGDYAGYIGSIADTLAGMGGNFMDQLKKTASNVANGEGINKILGDSSVLENIVGGGLMKLLGGPSGGDVIKAFLTGDPTGQHHLTVGNPMNPIMVCGNLALQDAEFSFEGPLGFEGFPTKMKVDISLKPGRPRDKSEIESMFNAGRGRIYLQPEWGQGSDIDVNAMVNVDAYGGKSGNNIKNAPYMSRVADMAAG